VGFVVIMMFKGRTSWLEALTLSDEILKGKRWKAVLFPWLDGWLEVILC